MARRRKGRDVHGWILVDKPAGLGSTDVVTRLRRGLDAKKAGHAGTLDPAATGVLAVAFGEATKTVPVVQEDTKTYRFRVRFGQATDTDDAEGAVIAESDRRPDPDAVTAALGTFVGDIRQVPPRYSAVKVDGARAYDLAREAEDFDLEARDLHVEALRLEAMPDADHADLVMTCGKGGYVRAIARDLGAALGGHGHCARLRRIGQGPFAQTDCVDWATLTAAADAGHLDDYLVATETALARLPEARCDAVAAARLRNGNPAPVIATDADYGDRAWASAAGRVVAIGTYRAGELHPSRVILA